MDKVSFHGLITSVQPRIRLLRSFDERSHNYMGYALQVTGMIAGGELEFSVGIGKAAQEKHQFQIGDEIQGETQIVADMNLEAVEFYKVSGLKVIARGKVADKPPPWFGIPPTLEVYRERGHLRLDAKTYEDKCWSCIWGALMPVEMTIDQWAPQKRKYRQETFCYGPKSCKLYKTGPTRKVPGRKGMVWEEEPWMDADGTGQRGEDD